MKAVMYHYVRFADVNFPHSRFLDFSNFQKQLDFFTEQYGFIAKEKFNRLLKGENAKEDLNENEILLTFDDALSDHYHFVFPELKKRGLWALFFVNSGPYLDHRLLNVHRIHYLLGKFGADFMMDKLAKRKEIAGAGGEEENRHKNMAYLLQENSANTDQFKWILNYSLSPEKQEKVLADFISELIGAESDLQKQYYLKQSQIQEMSEEGMFFGAHGHTHTALAKLSKQSQRQEIEKSFDFIESIVAQPTERCFCYPFGGKSSFTPETEQILELVGCKASFTNEPRNIASFDFATRRQALPRFDCNQLPFGKAN